MQRYENTLTFDPITLEDELCMTHENRTAETELSVFEF